MQKNQANSVNWKKWGKWLLIGILSLALLLIGLNLVAEYFIEKKIKDQPESDFTVDFSDLDLNLFTGKIAVDNLTIVSDTLKNQQSSYQIKADKVSMNGIAVIEAIFNQNIQADDFTINNVHVDFVRRQTSTNKDTTNEASKLQNISFENINLNNASFNIYDNQNNQPSIAVDSFFIEINDFESSNLADGQDTITLKNCEFSFANLMSKSTDRQKTTRIRSGRGNFTEETLRLKQFSFVDDFTEKVSFRGEEKAKMILQVPSIDLAGLKWYKLLFDKELHIQQMTLANTDLLVYTDKRYATKSESYKATPQESLLKTDFPIHIDSLQLENSSIKYEEFEPRSDTIGYITFERLYASLYNISNMPEVIAQESTAYVDVLCYFMGTGKLEVNFRFDLSSLNYAYDYDVQLGSMDIAAANTILIPVAFLYVSSGRVNELEFSVKADNELATGRMSFDYRDLEMKLLKKNRDEAKGFLSTLVNNFIVNSNNQKGTEDFAEGKIYAEREQNNSIFGHLWMATQSGFKSTMLPDILIDDKLEVKKEEKLSKKERRRLKNRRKKKN